MKTCKNCKNHDSLYEERDGVTTEYDICKLVSLYPKKIENCYTKALKCWYYREKGDDVMIDEKLLKKELKNLKLTCHGVTISLDDEKINEIIDKCTINYNCCSDTGVNKNICFSETKAMDILSKFSKLVEDLPAMDTRLGIAKHNLLNSIKNYQSEIALFLYENNKLELD